MNSRLSNKERNLLKGAIRRVFSRSELRRMVVDSTRVEHHDPDRPRVRKWSRCQSCDGLTPTYQIEVDHRDPIVPVDSTLQLMTWDEVVERTWCERNNLWGICEPCHKAKTKAERQQRPRRSRKKTE